MEMKACAKPMVRQDAHGRFYCALRANDLLSAVLANYSQDLSASSRLFAVSPASWSTGVKRRCPLPRRLYPRRSL